MTRERTHTELGEPDLQIAGLQIWIHGRQFPEAEDYYDVNWLRVTAHCSAPDASVWARGAILMVTDIAGFGAECAAMHRGSRQSAALTPLEPELSVLLKMSDSVGHIRAQVDITPNHLLQSHRLEFEIDQSFLPDIIKHCSIILEKYPIRGQQ